MADEGTAPPDDRRGRSGPWLILTLAAAMAAAWLALALHGGRPVVAPDWLTERIEDRAEAALAGAGRLDIGSIVAVLGEGGVPRIVLRDLRLSNAVGAEIARVPEARARLSAEALFGGRFELTRLTVMGADLTLRRDRSGRFDLAFGNDRAALARVRSVVELLDSIDAVFSRPALAGLDGVSGEALRLTFQDAMTGRVWRAENGALTIRQEADRRSLALRFSLAGSRRDGTSEVNATLSAPRGEGALDLSLDVAGATGADIAGQVPALAWLSVTDAPLSTRLRGKLSPEGRLLGFDAALEIGAGSIGPAGGARPVPFDGASARVSYDPGAERLSLDGLSFATAEARFRADGHAYLRDIDPVSQVPARIVAQLRLADIEIDPADELAEPARFETGAADFRLSLSPFRVELGQLALMNEGRRFLARGEATAGAAGWQVALDLGVDAIRHDRLLAFWPVRFVPRTRDWLARNVLAGELSNVDAAVRLMPGEEPRLAIDYEFEEGSVRFLRTLPPLIDSAGRGAFDGIRYTMALSEGAVVAPDGGRIDAAGTVFTVEDVRPRPATAEVRLRTESSLTSTLSLLDEPPFEFLSKAGRTTDLAEGRARLSTVIRLPLRDRLQLADVDVSVAGRLGQVASDTLVPGRRLEADELQVDASNERLVISGPGRLGAARFDAAWSQQLGPEAGGGSRVEGVVVLDQGFLDEFGVALPPGSVSGSGMADIELDLAREQPAAFRLGSDLEGLALSIPALSWSKPRSATGRLEVEGRLGQPATIERLALSGPGLEASGRVRLNDDGSLRSVNLDRVRAGRWLDAPVELTARGRGRAPAVAVKGGQIDLRATSFGGSGQGGGQDGGGPVSLALDRLIVSEGIAFSGFRADLSTGGGLNGRFSGRLAGQAPVEGVLAPSREGTAVRLRSDDAGAVLRAAGLLESARRGALDLTLVPLPGEGRYDGRFAIRDLSLRGAPALADLLGAISVVGLLEQLNGQGILFGEVTGEFTLEPAGVTLHRGSAIGASLGVSMAGVYDLRSRIVDMRGTISPIYLINGIGQIFSRRGEGLFGFNYRMSGPAASPRTTVNPLSILTPGMFREIFRAPPPQLTQ